MENNATVNRREVVNRIKLGMDRKFIAKETGLTPDQVSGYKFQAIKKGELPKGPARKAKKLKAKTRSKGIPKTNSEKAILRKKVYTMHQQGFTNSGIVRILSIPKKKVRDYIYYEGRIKQLNAPKRPIGRPKKTGIIYSPQSVNVTRISGEVLEDIILTYLKLAIVKKFGKISGVCEIVVAI